MTPLEIIALIFAILAIVKMLVLLIDHKKWMKVPDFFVEHARLFGLLYLALAILVGYFLFVEIGVVNLFVAVLFAALIIALTWITDANALERILAPYKSMTRAEFLKKYWIELVVWFVFAGYVLYVILF